MVFQILILFCILSAWQHGFAQGSRPETTSTNPTLTNPFDPGAYIKQQQITSGANKNELQTHSVYRLNGKRYFRFDATTGAVLLPSIGNTYDVTEASAVCGHHLKFWQEVLPIREKLPLDKKTLSRKKEILALIEKCQQGKIAGPVITEQTPGGETLQIKAKAEPPRDTAADKIPK